MRLLPKHPLNRFELAPAKFSKRKQTNTIEHQNESKRKLFDEKRKQTITIEHKKESKRTFDPEQPTKNGSPQRTLRASAFSSKCYGFAVRFD
ncbi:hypothetical protein A3SI_03835 [Nitritalea halalkaliphila LW7]|uniref:Uncharacterized protein n=1 Tax=Nitritalea halalkaliphila LW7 TaxID=1189621 RepID=I5C973_9BACT|nr:hypothetical protein A3SI_03835 [Nitritalea halalkaliphila LW7]